MYKINAISCLERFAVNTCPRILVNVNAGRNLLLTTYNPSYNDLHDL